MLPSQNEIVEFRKKLEEDGVEITKDKLLQKVYGEKDNWKCRLAMSYIEEQKAATEIELKQQSLEHEKQSNVLQANANTIAKWALGISIIALMVSTFVAIFK